MKVNIPEPCHEDWNKMDSQEKGRFCGSCEKLIIDFTAMSDSEIVNYFKIYKSENTCGHLKKTQIDRILKPQQTPHRKLFLKEFAAACFAFFLASTEAKAQSETVNQQTQNSETSKESQKTEIAINGKVKNGNETLSNAIIYIKGTNSKTFSLSNGLFSIHIPNEIAQNQSFITLVVKYNGFGTKEIEVATSPTNQFVEIDFEENKQESKQELGYERTITGTMTDVQGETLPGATVQIKGTNNGTTTDIEGKYTLPYVSQDAILVFRYVGFDDKEETIGNRTVIDVSLESGELQGGMIIHYKPKWYSPKRVWYKIRNIFR